MYVSRRLRVFDDPVLAPLVLSNQLPVSTAEELLREPDVDARRELAGEAVDERWTQPAPRREVAARRNVTLLTLDVVRRLDVLAAELDLVDPAALGQPSDVP
jgi:hypothetical protein